MRIRAVTGNYRISTDFGWVKGYPLHTDPNDPVIPLSERAKYPGPGYGWHTGKDYVSNNREVVAPQDSRVVSRGYDKTNGFYIVLESNGYRDWFSHLVGVSIKVNIGEFVKQGQLLATMGNTGYASGVHLHHSLRLNGVLVDPELYIMEKRMITSARYLDAMFQQFFMRNSTKAEQDKWIGKKTYDELIDTLQAQKAYKTTVKYQETGAVAVRDNWQGQIEGLTAQNQQLKEDLANQQYEVINETLYRRK